jgi:DNA-binding NarL/FixJ family response regulator
MLAVAVALRRSIHKLANQMKESGHSYQKNDGVIRILLVDDHPLVRESLKTIIQREPDLAVCGEAEDREQALELAAATEPEMALVDLTLKNSHGLELIKDLCNLWPKIRILVLSMQDEALYAERVIRAGAQGYISKQEVPAKILLAIRHILSGKIYWSEKAAAHVASKIARSSRPGGNLSVEVLTDREVQVFELLGAGKSTHQIAATLHINASTVETYRSRIKEKLNIKNALELLQFAIRCSDDPK